MDDVRKHSGTIKHQHQRNKLWFILRWFFVVGLILGTQGLIDVSDVSAAATINFTGAELIGTPTDSSVVINIIPLSNIEYYYEYGTSSGVYTQQTGYFTAGASVTSEIEITGLLANTEYFYRMKYHAPGDAMDDWVIRDEHSFWTQREAGSSFVFAHYLRFS